ncbi:hypothetical protein SUGI_0269840 [Cryptomeria japonica]|uniref:uncharacterized protein LOC131041374 n=1 Tax=Cryptomeria japonica TaxID=3369 RepID=UPI002408BCC7|nr:uncharacterized protein LOC131041374 [Cryptomeria japonica]GLJ16162.1 hypothetical protein SUGI_0269840 [Cryptomeria japonica]
MEDLSMDLSLNLSPPAAPPDLQLALTSSPTPTPTPVNEQEQEREGSRSFPWPHFSLIGQEEGSAPFSVPLPANRIRGALRRRVRSVPVLDSGAPSSRLLCTEAVESYKQDAEKKYGDDKKRIHENGNENREASVETEEKANANFECNICLEMASEPVVTLCGHLFCWPCLYQWLHEYSSCKECPVCKGEVTDNNITPIYGRGVKGGSEGKGGLPLPLPPRPHAHRVESARQRERFRDGESAASLSRRVEEIIRVRNGRRLLLRLNSSENGNDRLYSEQHVSRFRATRRALQQQTDHALEERLHMRERLFGRRHPLRFSSTAATAIEDEEEEEEEGPTRRRRRGIDEREAFGVLAFDRMAAIRARLASMEGMLQSFATITPPPEETESLPLLVIPSMSGNEVGEGERNASSSSSFLSDTTRDTQSAGASALDTDTVSPTRKVRRI